MITIWLDGTSKLIQALILTRLFFLKLFLLRVFYMKPKINITDVTIFPDGRLDTENAAAYLGLAPKTLATMRAEGRGPVFIKRGRVFYFRDDLDKWIHSTAKCCSTAQARICNQQAGHTKVE